MRLGLAGRQRMCRGRQCSPSPRSGRSAPRRAHDRGCGGETLGTQHEAVLGESTFGQGVDERVDHFVTGWRRMAGERLTLLAAGSLVCTQPASCRVGEHTHHISRSLLQKDVLDLPPRFFSQLRVREDPINVNRIELITDCGKGQRLHVIAEKV